MSWKPIRCQEKCPIGKHCCFGEVRSDSLIRGSVEERHKCLYRKQTGRDFVFVLVNSEKTGCLP